MRRTVILVLGALLVIASQVAAAASLDKAKSLRANGLRDEAKKELVDLLFQSDTADLVKAEALLLLGEIAVDERNYDSARDNWGKLVTDYPQSSSATSARAKLELLAQVADATPVPSASYPAGTVLVVGPPKFSWAAARMAAALGSAAVSFAGSLAEAMKAASGDAHVVGIVEVALEVDTLFESGRVVCYRPDASQAWEKKVRISSPGGEEHIARVFVNKLSTKIKGKTCP